MRQISRAAAILALAAFSLSTAGSALAQNNARPPVFKGTWSGPAPKPAGMAPAAAASQPAARGSRSPTPKRVLVLGGARGWHHDSIPSGMAAVFNWGRTTTLWESELRTEYSLVNGRGGKPMTAGFRPEGLRDFDAIVVVSATGSWDLDTSQKQALLDFVRGGGGLVVMHGALDANHDWKDYVDMVGGEFVSHPFNTGEQPVFPFPLLNENPQSPITSFLPRQFVKQDELYVLWNYSRDDVEVLISVDKNVLDMSKLAYALPPDRDIPVAWIKQYGKGRVFASTFGHTSEAFDDPEVARVYTEAIKWAMRLTGPDARPGRPAPAQE